jgi:DNA-binding NarL/FixJ family response regulator
MNGDQMRDPASAASERLTAVVADDSVLLRDGVVRLLGDGGIDVLAAVGDGEALVAAVAEHQPDIALIDVRMPPTHTDEGIRAALAIRSAHPDVAVLVLSQYVEERYATELLSGETSGVGYLLKDRVVDVEDFVVAVRRVAAGGSAVDAEVVRQLLGRTGRTSELERLTPREREVLSLMAEGMSNAGIAEQLVVSLGAVEKHISNVFSKLDLPQIEHAHRRVLAVLTFLNSR